MSNKRHLSEENKSPPSKCNRCSTEQAQSVFLAVKCPSDRLRRKHVCIDCGGCDECKAMPEARGLNMRFVSPCGSEWRCAKCVLYCPHCRAHVGASHFQAAKDLRCDQERLCALVCCGCNMSVPDGDLVKHSVYNRKYCKWCVEAENVYDDGESKDVVDDAAWKQLRKAHGLD